MGRRASRPIGGRCGPSSAAATVTAGLLAASLHNNHTASCRFALYTTICSGGSQSTTTGRDYDAATDDTPADDLPDAPAALRSRQKTLEADSAEIDRRWRKADCTSKVRAALDGWIRRLACWPLAAIGTATGDVRP